MALSDIKSFSDLARSSEEVGAKLRECMKISELIKLARANGFELDEVELYPPNEPQFTSEQLSPRLVDALLRT